MRAQQLPSAYRKRWSIEVFFQALKGRGFNLEKPGLRCHIKMRKLFAIACLAYTICWAVAIENGKIRAVRPKKHGYTQYSIFRRGLNLMRKAFKGKVLDSIYILRYHLQFDDCIPCKRTYFASKLLVHPLSCLLVQR